MMQLLENSGMTYQGWIFFGLSWSIIIGVLVFCYAKVLRKNGAGRKNKSK